MDETSSQRIGLSVRALREAAGMSQADLAERMSARGLPGFYPQTITKIEGGSRELKLREGLAMAEILGVGPAALAGDGQDDIHVAVARLTAKTSELRRSRALIEEAADRAGRTAAELSDCIREVDKLVESRWPPKQFGPGRPGAEALPIFVRKEYEPAVYAAFAELDELAKQTTGKSIFQPVTARRALSRRLTEWLDVQHPEAP